MPTQKPTRPDASSRMITRKLGDDPAQAHQVLTAAVASLETKVGLQQKAATSVVTLTGSKGGNAALASVIALLVQLGYAKDETT